MLISLNSLSQKDPNIFLTNLCPRYNNGIGESKGINIELNVPCEWGNVVNNMNHGIFKYNYQSYEGDIGVLATEALIVADLGSTTNEDAKYLITESGLRLMTKGATGAYISFNYFLVNNSKAGQVVIKNELKKQDGIYLHYTVQDYVVYKRKLILVQYTITAKSDKLCRKYLVLFDALINKTKLK